MIIARVCPSVLLLLAPVATSAAPGQLDVTVAEGVSADAVRADQAGLSLMAPALRCTDIDRSLRFYTEGLGMVELGRVNLQSVTEVILGFSKEQAQPGIMLIKRKSDGPAPPAVEHGTGYQRSVLRVPDVKAAAARLSAAGYPTGQIGGSGQYRILMVQDPDGYRYELVEFPKPGAAANE